MGISANGSFGFGDISSGGGGGCEANTVSNVCGFLYVFKHYIKEEKIFYLLYNGTN